MADIPFLSPVMAAFRGLPAEEKAAQAKLVALEAELPAVKAAHLAAVDARRKMRAEEMILEDLVQAKQAELAGLSPTDPKANELAIAVVRVEAQLTAIRGTPPGRPYVPGRADAVVIAENSALDRRQTIERAIAAQRDIVENLARLRNSDVGRDTAQLADMGMLPAPMKIERYPAENVTAEDAGRRIR